MITPLSQQPKYCSVLKPNDKLGARKKGCRTKASSVEDSVAAQNPSASIVSANRPVGRESMKKKKAIDFGVDKVSKEVLKNTALQLSES